jgi:hypothetical protein
MRRELSGIRGIEIPVSQCNALFQGNFSLDPDKLLVSQVSPVAGALAELSPIRVRGRRYIKWFGVIVNRMQNKLYWG